MMRSKARVTISCLVLLNFVFGSPLHGATKGVQIGGFFFSPSSVTITNGDSVVWTNRDAVGAPGHDTTHNSATPLWGSPLLSLNQTFSFTFLNAGSYPYFCNFHHLTHPEQTGTVTVVTSGNLPPTVAITSPTNNSVFFQPAPVTIQANASDSGGSVSQVQFLAGTNSLGNDATGPSYSITASNLAAGSYALRAIATDNLGARGTSGVVNVTIKEAAPLLLSSPRFTIDGHFQFDYSTDAGLTYVVRRSSVLNDVVPQVPINTNRATTDHVTFTDSNVGPNRAYSVFRVVP